MAAGKWYLFQVAGVLLLAAGCRTTTPELKPSAEKEVLRSPPSDARFSSGGYPKQAFDTSDPTKRNPLGFGNPAGGPAMRNSMAQGGGMGAGGMGAGGR